MNKSIEKILIIIAILFVTFFVYKIFFYKKPVPKIITCEEWFDRADDALKEIEIKNYRNECAEANDVFTKANQAWREYAKIANDQKCTLSRSDKLLDKKIYALSAAIAKAGEIALEKDSAGACQLALTVRKDLVQLKKDSNIPDISLELLDFFVEIDKFGPDKKKAEVMEFLPDLKYKFTLLKQYNFDANYTRLINDMEKNIGYLDKFLDGPDFQKAQGDLEGLFWEMYYRY